MTSVAVPVSGPVPTGIEEVTASWLTEALGTKVTAVRAERIALDTGFSAALYRIHLNGSDDVPETLIVKLPADSLARGGMEMLGGYHRELYFYRHVAPDAPIATPHCHVARMSGPDFVLVLEDLRDWENADHLAGLSLPRAQLCIQQLAGLHAWSVGVDEAVLQEFPSIDSTLTRDLFLPAFAPGWQLYRDHTRQSVPAAVATFAERFADLAPTALTALADRNMLLHGDIRADNMFFREDALKVVDFQLTVRGAGAADIAYLVSQGLPTEVRRGRDEELVREYVSQVDGYTFDEAWRHYRLATALLLYMPVVALLTWDVAPERSRQLCLTLIDRAVAAIEDIDALEVFA
ncbi:phosphotransferase [Mycolicibacterium peregrinum]|uniref:Aminoglycoside phosphotransferase n=1 Tax=Mycolicibacterium peregrinum TaxID=43304 RepID=A0A1A1ZJH2_MYCPR|nr:phosphotransferase [Mycolicibacterium peregrinum]OBB79927.1 aminoglycoside phosphotransferase [Mycolicibacterium peregrinum]OBF43792.1 aminoglycoside phosphotransferase [Mycolicibacterium peregrinum]